MKVVVKLGGSSLVEDKKRDSTNYGAIKSLTGDLIRFYNDTHPQLALITGGGHAHNLVKKYKNGDLADYMVIHEYVQTLRNTVVKPLIKAGIRVDVYDTFEIFDHKKHRNVKQYLDYLWQLTVKKRTFENSHVWNSCGDIYSTTDEKLPFGIVSGDDLAIHMAKSIRADRIVFVINEGGIFRDLSDRSSLIKRMYANNISEINFGDVDDQTGGIKAKVVKSREALADGIPVYFVNKNNFLDALYGKDVPSLLLPEKIHIQK